MIAKVNGSFQLLDHHGKPMVTVRPKPHLADLLPPRQRRIVGTYDAARTTDDFKNYWANADTYDADSANSRTVRETLVARSRYEIGNNGYADGIGQTYATDLIGVGPTLHMESGSEGFNRMVEFAWTAWAKTVQFRRKLWCMAHAKYQDGEALAVLRRNPRLRDAVQLDLVLYETEQCQTPSMEWRRNQIDGIYFDDFGNPLWYDILPYHPGATTQWLYAEDPERVPARYVCHWFKLRRPGQHRGIPEATSTLNTGAAARRWREATLAAAETAADFSVFLKTGFQPDEVDAVTPMSTLDIQKRMMTALPQGWDAVQMRAEHPSSTYESFMRTHISEMARPKSMPYNKAACDSSSYNYASGRLDHQTYYAGLNVEREDCNDTVLDVMFREWFAEAIAAYGWLGGRASAVSEGAYAHSWDWPSHQVADIQAEASSVDTRLKNGSLTLSRYYSEQGRDYADELAIMAADYGVSEDEMKQILMAAIFNAQNQQASLQSVEVQRETAEQAAEQAEQAEDAAESSTTEEPDESEEAAETADRTDG